MGLALGRFAALLAPLALVMALLALPADEARADSGHPGRVYIGNYTGNALHCAAGIDGDLAAVVHLLGSAHWINVNARDRSSSSSYSCGGGSQDRNRYTPLHWAARYGRATIAATLIAAGAEVDAKSNNGETPLLLAALYGRAAVAAMLIAAGTDVNAKNNNGETPLHWAASNGRATIAATLIAAGAEVDAKDSAGNTPLHSAAHGHVSVVSLLLAAGAEVNATTNYGRTPLSVTWHDCRNCRPSSYRFWSDKAAVVASVLIAAGGHWGEACTGLAVVNPAGPTPPCRCESPNVGTADNCQAPSAQVCGGLTPPKFYDASAGECVPLATCRYEEVRNAETNICECHAPNVRADYGYCRAPSAYYCGRTSPSSFYSPTLSACAPHDECVAAGDCKLSADICRQGFSPPQFYSPTLSACAPHDECVAVGNCELSANICARGFTPGRFYDSAAGECVPFSMKICGGLTPPRFFNETGCVPLVNCHPTALRKADNSGCECPPGAYAHGNPAYDECHAEHTPLSHSLHGWLDAIRNNNLTLAAHFLREHGQNPDDNNYHLHAAVNASDRPLVSVLIAGGANLDRKNSNGDTALHESVRLSDSPENVALVSLLLDKGADPNIRNDDGWRPLDLAYDNGGKRDARLARRMMMAALIAGGADWASECTGGKIPNEHYRPPEVSDCRCPNHLAVDNNGVCECPAETHAQVNGRCLGKGSAQLDEEIEIVRAELAELRAALVSLNLRLSLAAEADGPQKELEEVAALAAQAARGIARRRDVFRDLGRADLVGAAPVVALSDTAATCRMLGGDVEGDARVCSGIDFNDTFCLIDSDAALSCVGLFRHVRRCNDDFNRPALDPWHCAARCPSGLRARGARCASD